MKLFQIELNGENKKLRAARRGSQLWFHMDGETHCVDLRPKLKNSRGGAGAVSGAIMAPMPGRILKIFKAKGDAVQAGETLVIMEAMKMEYTLKSSVTGNIKEMRCKEADQVELHQLLVQVE